MIFLINGNVVDTATVGAFVAPALIHQTPAPACRPAAAGLVSDVVRDCIAAKRSASRREIYVKSLAYYLRKFSEIVGNVPLSSLTAEDVERIMSKYAEPQTRATWLSRISSLFAFALKRRIIPFNPCAQIDRVSCDAKPIRILTPDECKMLVRATPRKCLPTLALCLWGGIRPHETMRLDWSNIDLQQGSVVISSAASKVRARRVVPLPPAAVRILMPLRKESGPVGPSHSTVRRWKRKSRDVLGWWEPDCLRHSAISYAVAMHEDLGKVATWMGNSPSIIKQHYDSVASKADAEKFYAVQ
jgi:integrase